MIKMECIKEYKGRGFLRENTNKDKNVFVKVGDLIDCDEQGYLWKDHVCFGHKDASPSSYFIWTSN